MQRDQKDILFYFFSGDELHEWKNKEPQRTPKELNKSNQIQFHYNDMFCESEIIF